MNILLTGSSGFIGSHVLDLLVAFGHRVQTVDMLEERVHGVPYTGAHVPRIVRRAADISYADVAACDVLVHLAAQVGVADSMASPFRYLEQNGGDTMALLQTVEQAHRNGVGPSRLVVASSMSVYGDAGQLVDEDAPVNPASVYALSKYDQERLVLMYADALAVDALALRFFNVYGPRQALNNPYTGVLANFAKRLLAGESPIVYEDGQQTRDFVYVEDVAEAVARAATSGAPSGVYNICTGHATTIEGIARQLALALNRADLMPLITHETRPGDVRHCTGSPRKAKRELGFSASVPLAAGLARYAAWLVKQ